MSESYDRRVICLPVPRDETTKLRIPLPNCSIRKFDQDMDFWDGISDVRAARLKKEEKAAKTMIAKERSDANITKDEELSP